MRRSRWAHNKRKDGMPFPLLNTIKDNERFLDKVTNWVEEYQELDTCRESSTRQSIQPFEGKVFGSTKLNDYPKDIFPIADIFEMDRDVSRKKEYKEKQKAEQLESLMEHQQNLNRQSNYSKRIKQLEENHPARLGYDHHMLFHRPSLIKQEPVIVIESDDEEQKSSSKSHQTSDDWEEVTDFNMSDYDEDAEDFVNDPKYRNRKKADQRFELQEIIGYDIDQQKEKKRKLSPTVWDWNKGGMPGKHKRPKVTDAVRWCHPSVSMVKLAKSKYPNEYQKGVTHAEKHLKHLNQLDAKLEKKKVDYVRSTQKNRDDPNPDDSPPSDSDSDHGDSKPNRKRKKDSDSDPDSDSESNKKGGPPDDSDDPDSSDNEGDIDDEGKPQKKKKKKKKKDGDKRKEKESKNSLAFKISSAIKELADSLGAKKSGTEDGYNSKKSIPVKLQPYNPFKIKQTPRAFIQKFVNWAVVQNLPRALWPKTFILYVTDEGLLQRLNKILAEPRTPADSFQAIITEFCKKYEVSVSELARKRSELQTIRKGPFEHVTVFLDRWERAYQDAYPNEDMPHEDRNRTLLNAIELDVREDMERHLGVHGYDIAKESEWHKLKDDIQHFYNTRKAIESLRSVETQATIGKLVHMQDVLSGRASIAVDQHIEHVEVGPDGERKVRRMVNDYENPKINDYQVNKVKRILAQSGNHQAQAREAQEFISTLSRAGREEERPFDRNQSNKRKEYSPSPQQSNNQRANQDSSKRQKQNQQHQVNSAQVKKEPKSKAAVNKVGLQQSWSQQDSHNESGRMKYGPCKGHPKACNKPTHDWNFCPRNPESRNFDAAKAGHFGDWSKYEQPANASDANAQAPRSAVNMVTVAVNTVVRTNMMIEVEVGGTFTDQALLDTGAEISLMSMDFFKKMNQAQLWKSKIKLTPITGNSIVTANNKVIAPSGRVQVELSVVDKQTLNQYTLRVPFMVMKELNVPVILGTDILSLFFQSIPMQGQPLVFNTALRPSTADLVEKQILGEQETFLYVDKSVLLRPQQVALVSVHFNTHILKDNPDGAVLCEPLIVYNKHGVPIPIRFPAHVTDIKQNQPGRYSLMVQNMSTHAVALIRNRAIGTVECVSTIQDTMKKVFFVDTVTKDMNSAQVASLEYGLKVSPTLFQKHTEALIEQITQNMPSLVEEEDKVGVLGGSSPLLGLAERSMFSEQQPRTEELVTFSDPVDSDGDSKMEGIRTVENQLN